MVESTAFFEAYRHVLEGLQETDPAELPFQVTYLRHFYNQFTIVTHYSVVYLYWASLCVLK